MEKALELFLKQGFEATSVQQITDYCGISKGAFYLSFKSKDELIYALIDDINKQIITDIDYTVRTVSKDQLLFSFYEKMFHVLQRYSDFARMMFKEQREPFNKEILEKLKEYNRLIDNCILYMLHRLYGDKVKNSKYDLVYCIRGLISGYAEFLFAHPLSMDKMSICTSLVEKTEILALYSKQSYITKELFEGKHESCTENVTKEKIVKSMEEVVKELDHSIEKESLILLIEAMENPNIQRAIVKGLIENIKNHPQCKWISLLLRNYFQI